MAGSYTANPDQPVFYYDLGSPQCYLVAETIMTALPTVPEWEPVLGSDLAAIRDPAATRDLGASRDPAATRDLGASRDLAAPRHPAAARDLGATRDPATPRDPATRPDPNNPAVPDDRDERQQIERQAADLGLQPVRWPPQWPPDSELAMLAATYAKRIGRAVAFSLAAFRQTFAGGRDLGDENTVLIAGAACEMHPTALRKGIELASTRHALKMATQRAQAAGVTTLPAIQIGERTYQGPDALKATTTSALR